MSEKLKPCPFCGGNELELFEGVVMFTALINCGKCKIQVRLLCIERDEKELAKAWNRRDGEGKNNDVEENGMVKKYRKLPVVIEAMQYDGSWASVDAMRKFGGDKSPNRNFIYPEQPSGEPIIKTLEGEMKVSTGDYVIKGVNGEFYPCKAEIFEKTYELVDDDVEVEDGKAD